MSWISAQVSLYPLKQVDISQSIKRAIKIFLESGLLVYPGPMSTLIYGNEEKIFDSLQRSFCLNAREGEVVMITTISNACPTPKLEEQSISIQAIGYVENQIIEPVSAEEVHAVESRIVLEPQLIEGLHGLEPGQRIMVVFHFHRSEGYNLLQQPRGDHRRSKRGVFSLCSPNRPNPIGVTVVELLEISKNLLRVRGLDAINGTPVLDIKPA